MNYNTIECKQLGKNFGALRALQNVSMQIPAGSVFGLLGPNGSGKTTTIRLMLGLLQPDAGSVSVFGLDPISQGDAVREQCGALLEHTGLYERLSAEDNLNFYGQIWHMPQRELQARMQELLGKLDLWDRRKELVGNWSRGMKQKLAVARAMLHQPKLVFLDEPTAGLDPVAAAALNNDLLKLVKDEQATIFLTTHNLSEAEKVCNLVGVLRKGQLIAFGGPHTLTQSTGNAIVDIFGQNLTASAILEKLRGLPHVQQVEAVDDHLVIELEGKTEPAEVIKTLVMNGAAVDEVRRRQAGLEESFLKLMEEENA
jgi:ABC-2 type transport system ATP-binding protein